MIIIGSKIATIGIKNSLVDKEAYYATFWRLIMSPICMLIILKFLNFNEMIEQIYLIYSALPVAVLMPIMAKKYGSDDSFASKVVVITHLVSLMTIPIFVWIYTIL
jgi:predicted permease